MSIELASYRRHRSVGQPILYTPNLCGLHQPYGNGLQTLNGKGSALATTCNEFADVHGKHTRMD